MIKEITVFIVTELVHCDLIPYWHYQWFISIWFLNFFGFGKFIDENYNEAIQMGIL